jgi:hypothetical protein
MAQRRTLFSVRRAHRRSACSVIVEMLLEMVGDLVVEAIARPVASAIVWVQELLGTRRDR